MIRLPELWVEASWRMEALALAELLFDEPNYKVQAVRALHHFVDNGDERMLTILRNDPNEDVILSAYKILGETAFPRLYLA